MSTTFEIAAENRNEDGTGSSRRLRRLMNKVPAIVYGGEKDPQPIMLDHNILENALENEAFYSHILTLDIAGKKEKVVLKDLHRHPSRPKILHADFQRVSPNTKISMHVPLHFTGENVAPGVKDQGGIISHHLSEVEIRCLPKDLPEFISVDVSTLSMGEIIQLSELKLPKGIEVHALLQGEDHPVVSIHKATAPAAQEPTEAENEQNPEEASPE